MAKEKQPKTGNWFQRHKVLSVIGGLIVLAIIINIATPKSNTATTTNPASSNAETTPAEKAAPAPAEKMTISNTSYADQGYGYGKVIGEIKNNDTVKHSATLKATFYDAAGKIIGTGTGVVNDVAPGELKTIELMTTDDVSAHATLKVAVDTLL